MVTCVAEDACAAAYFGCLSPSFQRMGKRSADLQDLLNEVAGTEQPA